MNNNDSDSHVVLKMGIATPRPEWHWECEITSEGKSEIAFDRILTVVQKIVGHGFNTWPGDDYWKNALPDWMLDFVPELSQEEADLLLSKTAKDDWANLPWEFGSWLDALRERKWQWFGYERREEALKIVLEMTDIPPRIEAFKQIIYAAGGEIAYENWQPSP